MVRLLLGTTVRLVSVDLYGMTGRERHPLKADVGFTGVVAAVLEDSSTEEADLDFGPEDHFCVYTVCDQKGRVLDLVDYEIEVLGRAQFRVMGTDGDGVQRCKAQGLDLKQAEKFAEDVLGSYFEPVIEQES